MPSSIDPSLNSALDQRKPVDKGAFKRTLKAAKQEIEELQSSVLRLQNDIERNQVMALILTITGDRAVEAIQRDVVEMPFIDAGAGWYTRDSRSAANLPETPGTGWRYTGTTPATAFPIGSNRGAGYKGFVEQGTGAGTVTIDVIGFTVKFGGGASTVNIGDRVWAEVYLDGQVGLWVESRG